MTRSKPLLLYLAALLSAGCALQRHNYAPPSEGCSGRVEISEEEGPTSVTYELIVTNDSTDKTTNATRVDVMFDDAPYPTRVSSPDGWTAFIRLCRDGQRVCGIEWRSCPGLVPGKTVPGFAATFASDGAPRRRGWSLDVGECQVGGISGVL
jgi:hypothetical protein